jgi:hypothetical protein
MVDHMEARRTRFTQDSFNLKTAYDASSKLPCINYAEMANNCMALQNIAFLQAVTKNKKQLSVSYTTKTCSGLEIS